MNIFNKAKNNWQGREKKYPCQKMSERLRAHA